MDEIVINLHIHSVYSDGHATHAAIAAAAAKAGIDGIIVTDHNIWVDGLEGYYRTGDKSVLVLVGEEIHDPLRVPQKNHLLVFGADQELATLADSPQTLISAVQRLGGLCFLAHPVDPAMPAFGETDISWEDWSVTGFTGIEFGLCSSINFGWHEEGYTRNLTKGWRNERAFVDINFESPVLCFLNLDGSWNAGIR